MSPFFWGGFYSVFPISEKYSLDDQSGAAALPDVGDQTGIESDSTLPFVAQMFSSEAPVLRAAVRDICWANLRPSSSSNVSRGGATGGSSSGTRIPR